MDPSIMKLLEEDEVLSLSLSLEFCKLRHNFITFIEYRYAQDESMHSGADVEAFEAALNRDIGGDASTSQLSDSDKGVPFDFSIYRL